MEVRELVLVDDHKLITEGLTRIISKCKDLKITAEADNGEDAVTLTKAKQPDIVLLDISLPDKNGLEVAQEILKDNPEQKILIISSYNTDEYI